MNDSKAPATKYRMSDRVQCAGCLSNWTIENLKQTENGKGECPRCGCLKFRIEERIPQYIFSSQVLDYSPRKDGAAGLAEFTVRLKGRKVSVLVRDKVVAETEEVIYETIYDYAVRLCGGERRTKE